MSKKINRAGEKWFTKEGYWIEIIECHNNTNCTIKFENGCVLYNKSYMQIKRGEIKNPYHKSVADVGYIGEGSFSHKNCKKGYNTWQTMLNRCYSEKQQLRQPTYKGVIVCEEWHCFQNFAEWYMKKYKHGFTLDKDILQKGNKIYSPETCCFVPVVINQAFVSCKKRKYPLGVYKRFNKFGAQLKFGNKVHNLGYYNTIEDAFYVVKSTKEKYIKSLAEEWKNEIDVKVYNVLMTYKIQRND